MKKQDHYIIGNNSRKCPDTINMRSPRRHDWLNTYVGLLDAAFLLTEEEQFQIIAILRRLLQALNIPRRGIPVELPPALVMEITSGFYTISRTRPMDAGRSREVRRAAKADMVASVEAWRDVLLSMLITAYPDMDAAERLTSAKVFEDTITAIGVPNRAATFLPDDVVRAHLSGS
jgi:hypothetical protein